MFPEPLILIGLALILLAKRLDLHEENAYKFSQQSETVSTSSRIAPLDTFYTPYPPGVEHLFSGGNMRKSKGKPRKKGGETKEKKPKW